MGYRVRLQCPECAEKFWSKQDFAAMCPKCGYEAEIPDDNVICAPFIKSQGSISVVSDKVYRDMEKASEHRAEQAAEMAGVPVSEMSHLKITNMRDNVQVGESAAMPVTNEVTRQMDLMAARGMPIGFTPGAAVDGSRAGAAALGAIQRTIFKP